MMFVFAFIVVLAAASGGTTSVGTTTAEPVTTTPAERKQCVIRRYYSTSSCTVLNTTQPYGSRDAQDSTCRAISSTSTNWNKQTCKIEGGQLVPDKEWKYCDTNACDDDDNYSCPTAGSNIDTDCNSIWGDDFTWRRTECVYCDELDCDYEFADDVKANSECILTSLAPEAGNRHCLIQAKYDDPACNVPTTNETQTAYDNVCRKVFLWSIYAKGYCTRDANNNVVSGKLWSSCTSSTTGADQCDDGATDYSCPTAGKDLTIKDSECVDAGWDDGWEKYICVPCEEMSCNTRMYSGSGNLNPSCPANAATLTAATVALMLGVLLL